MYKSSIALEPIRLRRGTENFRSPDKIFIQLTQIITGSGWDCCYLQSVSRN